MKRERPTSVLVLAIFNSIFGSLGLLIFGVCGLFAVVVSLAAPGNAGGPNPFAGAVNPLVEVQKAVGPGATAFLVVQSLGALLFCTLLLVSGIGLIGMRPWARWLAV